MTLARLVTGLLLALALFWCGASLFVRGDGVPDWWLPFAIGAGLAAGLLLPRAATGAANASDGRAPTWALLLAVLVVAVAFGAVAFGAVATPSRHWDGAASFDAKVFWLSHAPTLQQPFFAQPGVFHHGPDYPLLQALLVAMLERRVPGCGRLVMPLLYLLLCGVVAVALRRRAVWPLLRVGVTVAVAVTPALLTPGGGAVDSGYSELLMLLATTVLAAGLLCRSALWFGVGVLLAIVSKPEGTFYALVAATVAFVRADRELLRAALLAGLLAAITWLPVRAALLHVEPRTWTAFGALLAAAAAASVALRLSARAARPALVRWTIALGLPLLVLAALPWLAPLVAEHSALGVYLRQAGNLLDGLGNLPAYLAAFGEHGFARLRFGAALLLPLAALAAARAQRRRLGDAPLATFVALGLLTTALPFVLSPEPDLQHHLRSSLPRLLLHWIGPALLLSAAWLDELANAHADRPDL
ncbi:MAG: hypothetical protein KAI24_25765 [Planctomycetes bacterium]|nr:hypothetical protein [Planctomycetota bacterium]